MSRAAPRRFEARFMSSLLCPFRAELPLTTRDRNLRPLVVTSAQGGNRTRMPFGATPSRWCVYQFHHLGEYSVFLLLGPAPSRLAGRATGVSAAELLPAST